MYNIKSFKGFNWIGFFTLYKKEVKRFFNVFAQTILAPAVTTILFYLIFTLSMDRDFLVSGSHSYSQFLAPGLICMSIMQNAFANLERTCDARNDARNEPQYEGALLQKSSYFFSKQQIGLVIFKDFAKKKNLEFLLITF